MASFTQQQLSTEQRKLYSITRSEASELVHMYMVAQERSEDGGIEHLRAFRNELENAQGAYLGKYNNSQETSIYLNWAIYNWNFEYKTHHEDLDDNCFETNTCCICGFEGEDVFYFSTAYGLDNPVCDICVRCSNENEIDREDDDVTDADYVVDEEDEAEDIEDDEADEDYDDYEVYDDYEDEPEYDEDDEETASEDEDDDEEESESEDEESEDEESASEVDEEDEDEKIFGCVGCNYEWRDGWIHGYKAALKKMNKTIRGIKKDIPNAPRCANCDDSHADLKRCGGCNYVQYCSVDCQSHDWKRKHKNECALYA